MEHEVKPGTAGDAYDAVMHIISEGEYDKKYDLNNDGKVDVLDLQTGATSGEYTEEQLGDPFAFTYKGGEFDPTSEEFRQYVETTGSFDALIKGYGEQYDDFDDYYGKPLEYLETQKDITTQGLEENLRSAKSGFATGQRAVGLSAGKSLSDIYSQTSRQAEVSGFGPGGAIAATGAKAKRGVMGDYIGQQKVLAEGMTSARSTFDIGTQQKTLDYEKGVEEFWKTTEEDFYDTLSQG